MDKNKMAMLLFIASEAVFFLMLVIAFAFFQARGIAGPGPVDALHPLKTGIYSLCLFSSSFTVWRAGRHLPHSGRRGGLWLLATIILGAVFLVGQGLEYRDLLQEQITIGRNLFGTTFFTLTGFHGLHVFIGLILLGILWSLCTFGRKEEPRSTATEAIALYWHFVDLVWVVIFSVVYLWTFL